MTTAPLRSPVAGARFGIASTSTRRWAGVGCAVACLLAVQLLVTTETFPESWYAHIADPIDDAQSWIRDNRLDHWLFTGILNPISDRIEWALRSTEGFFQWLPWYVLAALVFLSVARARTYGSALFATACIIYPGAVGLWEPTTETLALTLVSVLLAVAIGLPVGVWCADSARAERRLGPLLDAMQVVPLPVYLMPSVLLFGIGKVPAAIATFIYAFAPMVRLTTLGLKEVPTATVEAGELFGSSRWQLLFKVRLPQAVRSIVAGINQTIVMALGLVIIAAVVGAGGLASEINETIKKRSPGEGFVVGFAIVALALVLDRVSRGFTARPAERVQLRREVWAGIAGLLVLAVIVGRAMNWVEVPFQWDQAFARPVDDWIRDFRDSAGWLTRDFNDWFVEHILVRANDFLSQTLVWPVLIGASALIAWLAGGARLAAFTFAGLVITGMTGLWEDSIGTLVQIVVIVTVAMVIAIPVGVFIGRRPRVEAIFGPPLDALQTIPSLIYAIPFVMVFTVGQVPGILAAILYAIPPGIRITSLGIKQVDAETVEAATTFGATNRQTLFGVRLPLALPTIMLAVNQVIMMAVAMVIIMGFVGGGFLGYQAVYALTRSETGLGFEVGVALLVMAMIFDRLTKAVAERFRPPAGV